MLTRIASFTVAVENLERSIAAYQSALGYVLQRRSVIGSRSTAAWRAPHLEGRQWALLSAPTGDPAALRLIEQPRTPGYDAEQSLGWTAIEIAVLDPQRDFPEIVDHAAQRLVAFRCAQAGLGGGDAEEMAGIGDRVLGAQHHGVHQAQHARLGIGVQRQHAPLLDQGARQRV